MIPFVSVCAGIEAASVAWAPLGWHACLLSEVEAFPRAVLAHRFGAVDAARSLSPGATPLWGDFTALRVRHLRRLGIPLPRLLVGGTPCQDFSVAGARASLDGARGNLSLDFVRLAHALGSAHVRSGADGSFWVVWENVPGVLSTHDNAFGRFVGGLVGGDAAILSPLDGGRWPRAGMASGPRARAAWRVLNAQHFGLAQCRERVLLVASLGGGGDPAAVLFEPQGVPGHPAAGVAAEKGAAGRPVRGPRAGGIWRQVALALRAGEAAWAAPVAGTLTGGGRARGGYSHDDIPMVAYGGGNTSGPRDVAACLTAKGQRQDFEVETFVVCAPALTTRMKGDNAGLEGHLVAHTLRGEGFDASEDGTGRGTPLVPVIAFNAREDPCCYGDIAGALGSSSPQAQAIAFEPRMRGDDGRGYGREPNFMVEVSPTLNTVKTPAVATAGVRRLTPRECERLQGFPDDFTLLPGRSADGPRYKSIGNSMPVPVIRWAGERICAADPTMRVVSGHEATP